MTSVVTVVLGVAVLAVALAILDRVQHRRTARRLQRNYDAALASFPPPIEISAMCRWCDRPIVQIYDFEVHPEPIERRRLWAHESGGVLGADRSGGIHLAEPA